MASNTMPSARTRFGRLPPIRFVDGAVHLGAVLIGMLPALYSDTDR